MGKVKLSSEHAAVIINNFTHLRNNAYSYRYAAYILNEQFKKDQNDVLKQHKRREGNQIKIIKTNYFLDKPRDHCFAIAMELLGKSIINEFEIMKHPDKVPDIAKYNHKFMKIHRRVKEIAKDLGLSEEGLEIGTPEILNKLYKIIKWGSRYHYDRDPIDHLSEVTIQGTIITHEANPTLREDELGFLERLFDKYHEIHIFLIKIVDAI